MEKPVYEVFLELTTWNFQFEILVCRHTSIQAFILNVKLLLIYLLTLRRNNFFAESLFDRSSLANIYITTYFLSKILLFK